MAEEKILITSALPYVNNVPHLGNLIGCVLSADVYSRFCKMSGKKSLFICGSDEHGTATETKAREEGVTPKELCDKYYDLHVKIYDWFNIKFDIFGRTSMDNHKKITQEMFAKVTNNGYIEEKEVVQPFCALCNTFLADRFVRGTCPHCQYEDAGGDQCDNCSKLLNPEELINPKCKTDGSTPEFQKRKHLFLSLDKLQPALEKWSEKQSRNGAWTENSIRTTNAWFKEGLKPRAISRDLKWGINIGEAVTKAKANFEADYSDKVFYVWFDAPIGYISITEQLLGEGWKDWWQDRNTKLVQFMGKDNTPFHSIIFPATLMAASEKPANHETCDFNLVNTLSVTEYLNYEHTKFSKSRGVGVFGDNAQDSGIPADVFRYMLMYNRPEGSDTQFTWKGLQERLNNELVANFGNLVNRTLTFTKKFFEGELVEINEAVLDEVTKNFLKAHRDGIKEYVELLEKVKLRDALMLFMKISSQANAYFQSREPWKKRNENFDEAKLDLSVLVSIIKDLAIMIEPYMPSIYEEIFLQLQLEPKKFNNLGRLDIGKHVIGEAKILFEKVEDELIAKLKEKYSGKEESKEVSSKKKEDKKESKNGEKMSSSELHLQVGKIIEVINHPKADKLYIEKVDVGEEEPVQIVSGLVPYYSKEELLGKQIIVVRNLKPAKLRGEMSSGMLLAAEDNDAVGVVTVSGGHWVEVSVSDSNTSYRGSTLTGEGSVVGSRVIVKGEEGDFADELLFDDFMKFKLEMKEGKLLIDGKELTVKGGEISADKNLLNGQVR